MAKAPRSSVKTSKPAEETPSTDVAEPIETAVEPEEETASVEDAEVIEETPPVALEEPEAPAGSDEPAVEMQEPAPEGPGADGSNGAPPAAAPKPQRRKAGGGFVALLLGGVIAGGAGYLAAQYPSEWPFNGTDPQAEALAVQTGRIDTQANQIAALESRSASLEGTVAQLASVADLAALSDKVDALTGDLDGIKTDLDAFGTRLDAVEKMAPEGSDAAQMAAEAYDRELANLREMFQVELDKVEAAQASAAELEAQAAAAARISDARAAMARISTALQAGTSFDGALSDLAANTETELPDALTTVAAEGVPTLAELQARFPEAARAAIDAAIREAVAAGEMDRFTAFMRTQLGSRSLAPRDGEDADAVLSRAEAALKDGRLKDALSELDALPEAAKPALADWRAEAETRAAALAAAATLADQLNTQ